MQQFLHDLRCMPRNCYVQIMACTDDDSVMEYLDEADDSIPRLDVTDDFQSERAQILRAQGPRFHFTYGDYLVKAMLGPVDSYFDSLDSGSRGAVGQDGCCSLV